MVSDWKDGFEEERQVCGRVRGVLAAGEHARLWAAREPALEPSDRDGVFPRYRMS